VTYKEYLIYKAYRYWKRELPVPYNLAVEMMDEGISPTELEDKFDDGYTPDDQED